MKLAAVALLACLAIAGVASASEVDPTRAAARFKEAEASAESKRFREALQAYEDSAALDPSGPLATVARARASELASRSEGDFVPLARLEEVRASLEDRARVQALARDLESFPDGPVRSEARLVIAEAFWHRYREPEHAAALLEQAVRDPAATRATRALALEEVVAIDRELGAVGDAIAALDAAPDLLPKLRAELHREARRPLIRWLALGVVAGLAVAGAVSFFRARRRHGLDSLRKNVIKPAVIFVALGFAAVATAVVQARGGGDSRPFWIFAAGVIVIDAIARAWRLAGGSDAPLARGVRAVACAGGVVAVAFLAVERVAPVFLEAVGL